MITWMRERLKKEEGFTLVELMVVVLIIAILIAIAIPTFLGARERAQDRAAQSNLRNALTAEKVYYTDEEQYSLDTGAGLIADIEPSLTFVDAAIPVDGTAVDGNVYLVVGDAAGRSQVVCVSAQSVSGEIFSIMDIATDASAGTYYASLNGAAALPACNADPAAAPAAGWDASGF